MEESDILKIMEQFSTLNSIFNFQSENSSKNVDFSKLLKMIYLIQNFKNSQKCDSNIKTPEFFDENIISPKIKTLKLLVPYLSLIQQKKLAILIKLYELKATKEFYENKTSCCELDSYTKKKNIIQQLKPYIDKKNLAYINFLENFIEISNLYSQIQKL